VQAPRTAPQAGSSLSMLPFLQEYQLTSHRQLPYPTARLQLSKGHAIRQYPYSS
jgi:hypothetical protein